MQKHTGLRDRTSLRLNPDTLAEVDAARLRRPGRISRNTWIAEAIYEKLARETADKIQIDEKKRANG